jgi:hypothetical protein
VLYWKSVHSAGTRQNSQSERILFQLPNACIFFFSRADSIPFRSKEYRKVVAVLQHFKRFDKLLPKGSTPAGGGEDRHGIRDPSLLEDGMNRSGQLQEYFALFQKYSITEARPSFRSKLSLFM